ncbi:hypothetical protein [uncultured Croceitalea sp.]|uniref:hypothetical protein n=1 Tax=uncultured Croceitalea sp. TaxID=1798908 RepID=UPI003305B0F1
MRVFEEKQWFNQWWVLLLNFSVIGLLLYFMYEWYIVGENIDKIDASNYIGQTAIILMLLLIVGLMLFLRLKTSINENGIQYRFTPFHRKKRIISWKEMSECYTRKYQPITEFGGWGIKPVPKSKDMAYNVKGNMGIQIKLKDGKKILIGTQKPEEAQLVINRYFKK